jgi:hypothetical protein
LDEIREVIKMEEMEYFCSTALTVKNIPLKYPGPWVYHAIYQGGGKCNIDEKAKKTGCCLTLIMY